MCRTCRSAAAAVIATECQQVAITWHSYSNWFSVTYDKAAALLNIQMQLSGLLLSLLLPHASICTGFACLQVKALFRNPRIIGRNFPICQLELSGIKLEISSMHTRPPRSWQQAAATAAGGSGAAAGSAVVPADVAEHCLGAGAAVSAGCFCPLLQQLLH
jgi:hypothetical protein